MYNIVSRIWKVGCFWDYDNSRPPHKLFDNGLNRVAKCGFIIWRGGTIQKFGGAVKSREMLHVQLCLLRDHMVDNGIHVKPESEWRYRVCSMNVTTRIDNPHEVIHILSSRDDISLYYKPNTGLHAHRIILPDDLGTLLIYDNGHVSIFTKDINRVDYIVSNLLCN